MDLYDKVDWVLLAQQKLALLKLLDEREDEHLCGLLAMIDAVQDDAEAMGYPVVWLSEDEEPVIDVTVGGNNK